MTPALTRNIATAMWIQGVLSSIIPKLPDLMDFIEVQAAMEHSTNPTVQATRADTRKMSAAAEHLIAALAAVSSQENMRELRSSSDEVRAERSRQERGL